MIVGSVIYTVQAVDEDRSPANNEITYSLISGDQGMFTIHPQRGDIQVHRLLDRERDGEQYSLVVSAVDNGQPSQSSQQTISVKVCLSISEVCLSISECLHIRFMCIHFPG